MSRGQRLAMGNSIADGKRSSSLSRCGPLFRGLRARSRPDDDDDARAGKLENLIVVVRFAGSVALKLTSGSIPKRFYLPLSVYGVFV